MKRKQYSIEINASPDQLYDNMLGISKKSTYEQWTKVFHPTSTYRGSWKKGSKILFIAVDEDDKESGMVSEIAENEPNRFVSIRHVGILQDDVEITKGPKVDEWAGGLENYTLEETANGTLLTVEIDVSDDHKDYFDKTWPKALDKLRRNIEKPQPK